jgi:hypothetical protein
MELIELYAALPCLNRIVVVLAEAQGLSRLSQLSFLKLGRPSTKTEKFGRWLADVTLGGGESLATYLIKEGYGLP